RLVERIVDAGQNGVLVDLRAVVDRLVLYRVVAERDDLTDHLGTDVDEVFGFECAGGADRGLQVAAHHLLGAKRWPAASAAVHVPPAGDADQQQDQHHEADDNAFHDREPPQSIYSTGRDITPSQWEGRRSGS